MMAHTSLISTKHTQAQIYKAYQTIESMKTEMTGKPFLWKFVQEIPKSAAATNGEEMPETYKIG